MSIANLIKAFSVKALGPIDIWDHVKPEFEKLGVRDEIYFFADPKLDHTILRGKITSWSYPTGVAGRTNFVADITYADQQPNDWQRLVCCKEMMHIFDPIETRGGKAEDVDRLVDKIILPRELQDPFSDGLHALTDRVAVYYATAILFPLAARETLMQAYEAGNLSLEDIAELMEIPLKYAFMVMSEAWPEVHALMIEPARPFRAVRHTFNSSGALAERALLAGNLTSQKHAADFIQREFPAAQFEAGTQTWRIAEPSGRTHVFMIEQAVA